jgi:HEAT repeat protein
MTWFCPRCGAEVEQGSSACRACGADLQSADQADYEQKLIWALDSTLPETRLMAARILGERGARRAVPRLVDLAAEDVDPYLKAEVVHALGRISDPRSLEVVRRAANAAEPVVRAAAREVLWEKRR